MASTDINFAQAELVFERLAQIVEPLATHAGVGEMETVGHLVSYLLDHPRDIEPCLRFGIGELPDDWIEKGRLSYQARDGRIWRPVNARRARLVKSLEKLP
ncbi:MULTISPECIES: hypothetical protein [unclassified Sphingomonas]|uniref:hypothetical protein n=1 Tax=unclassified Sphingomonas TaxID=196159 RepID=UPI00226A467F|nr:MULTISPECIES: hypothetical protein [unclassified Sphingomonas]